MMGKRSLDGLMSHLVDQIALCGEHGALPSDFINYVKSYYADIPRPSQDITANADAPTPTKTSPNIDRPFLEHVWKWLIKHPEIRVGDHVGHKQLTLSEVEARNAAIAQSKTLDSAVPAPEHGEGSATPQASEDVASKQDVGPRKAQVAAKMATSPHREATKQSVQPDMASGDSETQGHLTHSQTNQVGPANKSKTKATRAEKPGSRASSNNVTTGSTFQPVIRLCTSRHRMWYAITGHGPDEARVKSFDFVCLSVIAASGPKGILQHNLTSITGQDKRSLPGRTDRLRDGGYIVKEPETTWVGEPRRRMHTSRCTLARYAKAKAAADEKTDSTIGLDHSKRKKKKEKGKRETGATQDQASISVTTPMAQPEPPVIPQWTSDRTVGNQIFELVDRSGTRGMSASEIRESLFGPKVRKITEDYVSRLVENWQISQPLYLRHLAIVQDTLLRGKSHIHIHFTYENFKSLVEGGTGFWEAVKTVPDHVKFGNNVAASLDAEPDVDEYGFPKLDDNQFHGSYNDATLAECESALNAGVYRPIKDDPWLKKQSDGTFVIQNRSLNSLTPGQNERQQPKQKVVHAGQQRYPGSPFDNSSEKTSPSRALKPVEEVEAPPKFTFLTRQVNAATRPVPSEQSRRRTFVRKPGKSRGRPRKYPKSGIPHNIHDMNPREIKRLRDSQEMAEKYERQKIEYEIVTRVEGGEDVVFVTNEVLAAADTLRSWDEMEPLPSFTRAQILHNFAGGPTPEAIEGPNGNLWSQLPSSYFLPKRGRTQPIPYWPSMAAHTLFVPGQGKRRGRPKVNEATNVPPMNTRPQRQRRPPVVAQKKASKNGNLLLYLPSVAAHTCPVLSSRTSVTETQQVEPNQSGDHRALKENRRLIPQYNYLPSIAAHSGSFLQHSTLPLPRPQSNRTRETTLEASPLISEPDGGGAYPGWRTFMSKYYEGQLNVIARPHDGFFFGDTKARRKRPIEPPGFRPPCFKVAIFKSARLLEFDWFLATETTPPQHKSVRNNNEQPLVLPATGASILQHDLANPVPLQSSLDSVLPQAPTISHSIPRIESSYFSPYDPKLSQTATTDLWNYQADGSYMSPYAGTNGTKRKRGDSPQPTRGSPPLGPSFSELVSTDSPSNEGSSIITLKPKGLASAEVRPADHRQADGSNKVDLQIASTLQGGESLEVESHSMASVSPVTLTAQGQNVDLASATTVENVPIADEQFNSKTPSEMESLIVAPKPRLLPDAVSIPVNLDHGNSNHHTKANLTNSAPDRTVSSPSVPTEAPSTIEQLADNHIVIPTIERSSVAPSRSPFSVDTFVAGQPSTSERINTASPSPASNAGESKPSVKNNLGRVSRLGGSVAILRRKIIIDLIEKCDGVFPSHREIVLPFAAEWAKKRGEDGTPEAKTVLTAVNQLCAEDKLRKITFSFQNKHGIVTTKTMLTLPNIDITDPRIRETQTQIAAHYPRLYIPPALLPEHPQNTDKHSGESVAEDQVRGEGSVDGMLRPSTSNPADMRRRQSGLAMTKGKNYMVEARLAALRAQDRGEAEHPDGLGSTAGLQSDHNATADRSNLFGRMLIVPPDPSAPPRPPRVPKPPKIRFRRLHSLKKRQNRPEPPFPLPQEIDGLENDQNSLTWLPSQYAFTEYNFEEERPTLVTPATDQARQLWSHKSKHVRFSEPKKRRTRRMQEIAENAARIERSQARGKPAQPYLPYPETLSEPFRSPYAPVRPPSPKVITPSLQQLPYISPYSGAERRISPGSDVGQIDTARRESIVSKSPTVSSSPDPPEAVHGTESILDLRLSLMQDSRPKLKRAALVGFMDPMHYFNRLSGTFHVSFSGIVPPRRLIFGGCGTAIKPFVHGVQGQDKRPRKRRRLEEDATPFEREIKDALNFELNTVGLQDIKIPGWPMINYVFPHAHVTAETEGTDDDTIDRLVRDPRALRASIGRNVLSQGSRNISAAATEALRRIQLQTPMKRRRLTSLMVHHNEGRTTLPLHADSNSRPAKIRRIRGTREETSLGPDGERRLLTAVAVVRTLTGGIERIIDWVLVAKAFKGMRDQMFIHRKWSHTLQKHKLILPKLEEDFQNMFMAAYEEGTVPPLNFENLASYDWAWLTEWAMGHFGTRLQSQPELPAERSEFDETYTFDDNIENADFYDYYETHGSASMVRRTIAANRSAFVYPFDSKAQPAQPNAKRQIATARTWVRANVITPEETYDPKAAREKLSTFPDNVIEDALKGLLLDRVLMQENKGRLVPGRNYDINEHFLGRLKRNLTANHFRRARAYKEQLDRNFAEQGSAPYSFTADDGDVLAIINMIANKCITLVPINVPANRWGLTDGGYESRQMDKRKLNFNIEIRPLPAYVEGSPLSPLPQPPCQHLHDANSKIPLWYDINDQIVPVMWDMAVAAVLSLLAVRPGINASVIEQGLRPAMEEWEIEWVLEWLVGAKAASKVGSGYKVDEWWWMAVGDREEVVDDGRSGDKGKGKDDTRSERQNSERSEARSDAGNVQSE